MTATTRPKLRARLKRVAGQIAGLQKMVDDDRYCVDILTQLAAARSALDAIGVELLTDHMEHCVAGCATGHPEARKRSHEQLVKEMRLALSRFLR
ncbi:MAG TPA: metal-sensitive transcriptional regulator [Tepidisphaeraceae bacterium]|nr:metal-sensitive transcriptional regulator [Tepidisphaeraceae bacterium]